MRYYIKTHSNIQNDPVLLFRNQRVSFSGFRETLILFDELLPIASTLVI